MTNIDPALLNILACPESHQPLRLANAEEVHSLNNKIQSGVITNLVGEKVSNAIEAALIRQDQQVCYPIRNGIPVLLVNEGIKY